VTNIALTLVVLAIAYFWSARVGVAVGVIAVAVAFTEAVAIVIGGVAGCVLQVQGPYLILITAYIIYAQDSVPLRIVGARKQPTSGRFCRYTYRWPQDPGGFGIQFEKVGVIVYDGGTTTSRTQRNTTE
jgi:hypothetical protein